MCVFGAVDNSWGRAMCTPKMRQFKQTIPSLRLWGKNQFIDGIKGEKAHRKHKNTQSQHNNHQSDYKHFVTKTNQLHLSHCYVLNGGKFGHHFKYQLGRLARKLKNPRNHNLPNSALINYLFPNRVSQSQIVEVVKTSKQTDHTPTQFEVEKHGYRSELLRYINAAAWWNSPNTPLTWYNIRRCQEWSIEKITSFRYHIGVNSFQMNFNKAINKCVMKTNNNFIFQFKHAYSFKYLDYDPILLAFGTFWRIIPSRRSNNWIEDKFGSMDQINQSERTQGWYFMTNLTEPVFLIHECVRVMDVKNSFPKDFLDNVAGFYKYFSLNMHELMLHRDELSRRRRRNRRRRNIHLPCGAVYKCIKHGKSRCDDCTVEHMKFPSDKWNLCWKCNMDFNPMMSIFDSKNGLVMTLMETVSRDGECEYY